MTSATWVNLDRSCGISRPRRPPTVATYRPSWRFVSIACSDDTDSSTCEILLRVSTGLVVEAQARSTVRNRNPRRSHCQAGNCGVPNAAIGSYSPTHRPTQTDNHSLLLSRPEASHKRGFQGSCFSHRCEVQMVNCSVALSKTRFASHNCHPPRSRTGVLRRRIGASCGEGYGWGCPSLDRDRSVWVGWLRANAAALGDCIGGVGVVGRQASTPSQPLVFGLGALVALAWSSGWDGAARREWAGCSKCDAMRPEDLRQKSTTRPCV